MSLTINRFGGGAGISDTNAILIVHVPTGSTVAASKSGVILTPKMWVSGSTADEDVAMFIFSPGQFDSVNPWTITATDGTDTASDTVLITANKEYEITLTYILWLYKRGNQYARNTGGWSATTGSVTLYDDHITLSNGGSHSNIFTKNKVDLTGYGKMYASIKVTRKGNVVRFGIANTRITNDQFLSNVENRTKPVGEYTMEMSLYNYQSSYYVGFEAYDIAVEIYEAWATP